MGAMDKKNWKHRYPGKPWGHFKKQAKLKTSLWNL